MNWRNLEFQQSESGEKPDNRADPASSTPDPIRGRAQLLNMILYGKIIKVSPHHAHQAWIYGAG